MFSDLLGKTLLSVDGLKKGSDFIIFKTVDGYTFELYHSQDCCESVLVEDVAGDVSDLLGSSIVIAEESISSENPKGVTKQYQESFTWTFYRLGTNKGTVVIRWYGESNGYYSERVDFRSYFDTETEDTE